MMDLNCITIGISVTALTIYMVDISSTRKQYTSNELSIVMSRNKSSPNSSLTRSIHIV